MNQLTLNKPTMTSLEITAKHKKVGNRAGNQNFWWAVHNLLGHPLSEIAFWLQLRKLSAWIHDETLPIHDTSDEGRG